MIEQEWVQFESTGHVADYLAYSRSQGAGCGGAYGPGYGAECGKGPEAGSRRAHADRNIRESETRDGADHCAYRYGVGGDTHRGL